MVTKGEIPLEKNIKTNLVCTDHLTKTKNRSKTKKESVLAWGTTAGRRTSASSSSSSSAQLVRTDEEDDDDDGDDDKDDDDDNINNPTGSEHQPSSPTRKPCGERKLKDPASTAGQTKAVKAKFFAGKTKAGVDSANEEEQPWRAAWFLPDGKAPQGESDWWDIKEKLHDTEEEDRETQSRDGGTGDGKNDRIISVDKTADRNSRSSGRFRNRGMETWVFCRAAWRSTGAKKKGQEAERLHASPPDDHSKEASGHSSPDTSTAISCRTTFANKKRRTNGPVNSSPSFIVPHFRFGASTAAAAMTTLAATTSTTTTTQAELQTAAPRGSSEIVSLRDDVEQEQQQRRPQQQPQPRQHRRRRRLQNERKERKQQRMRILALIHDDTSRNSRSSYCSGAAVGGGVGGGRSGSGSGGGKVSFVPITARRIVNTSITTTTTTTHHCATRNVDEKQEVSAGLAANTNIGGENDGEEKIYRIPLKDVIRVYNTHVWKRKDDDDDSSSSSSNDDDDDDRNNDDNDDRTFSNDGNDKQQDIRARRFFGRKKKESNSDNKQVEL